MTEPEEDCDSGSAHVVIGGEGDPTTVDLEAKAREAVVRAFGAGGRIFVGHAPGRVPLLGEHVDYVGGRVACVAIDLEIAVAIRAARDGKWRASSRGRIVERDEPIPVGDIGDRIFAAAVALRSFLPDLPPLEVGVSATLPESAGLSSSAAVVVAMIVALLRKERARMSARDMVDVALTAERDIVGVPCGSLDQQAVVRAPEGGVLILDFAADSFSTVSWPWQKVGLVVCDSGDHHDVATGGYGERRRQAEKVLGELNVAGCQEIGAKWSSISDSELRLRARHIATETARTREAIDSIRAGDLEGLGRLISSSHASLRDDFQVSTDRIDAMVKAAERIPGCYGSRIVGGGFGGSAIAICEESATDSVRQAMARAASRNGLEGTWTVHPSPGVASSAPDVVQQ
jgi:galactokinase